MLRNLQVNSLVLSVGPIFYYLAIISHLSCSFRSYFILFIACHLFFRTSALVFCSFGTLFWACSRLSLIYPVFIAALRSHLYQLAISSLPAGGARLYTFPHSGISPLVFVSSYGAPSICVTCQIYAKTSITRLEQHQKDKSTKNFVNPSALFLYTMLIFLRLPSPSGCNSRHPTSCILFCAWPFGVFVRSGSKFSSRQFVRLGLFVPTPMQSIGIQLEEHGYPN